MSLAAGDLTRQIRIEQRVSGQDEAGQPLDEWQPVATVWSKPVGQTGMGAITRNQENVAASINAYSFRIRFREEIDAGMRVVQLKNGEPMGAPFDIRQVRMDYARRDWTDLVCEQGGSDG
jgi:SPP1 family predicted phage head-tail adaptor